MLGLIKKVLGSANERALKKLQPDVAAVNALESKVKALTDGQPKE